MGRRILIIGVLAGLAAVSIFGEPSGPHPIAIHLNATPVYPGDVMIVTGQQRFTSGQLRNLSFRLAGILTEIQPVSADQVYVIAPDVPSGVQQFTIIKHDEQTGRDIVQFSAQVPCRRVSRQLLSTATGQFGSDHAILRLPNVAVVEIPEEAGRGASTITATLWDDPLAQRLFDENVHNVVASSASVMTIDISGVTPSSVAVRLQMPSDLTSAAAGPNRAPQSFAYVEACDDYDFVRVETAYNTDTNEMVISVQAERFLPPLDCSAASASSNFAAATSSPPSRSVRLHFAIANVQQVCGLFTVSGVHPASSIVEAAVTDTVTVAATLMFNLPRQLANPTVHGSGGIPIVGGSSYSASHQAVDLRSATGDPAFAAESGTIETVATQPPQRRRGAPPRCCASCPPLLTLSRGHYIEIRHIDGNATRYSHLQDPNSAELGPNQPVAKGGQFAETDNSGITCAPHLHFSYYVCGHPIDPLPWFGPSAPDPNDYVRHFTIVTLVNGLPIESTRQTVDDAERFQYSASFDVAATGLTSGTAAPLSVVMEGPGGSSYIVYRGSLKVTQRHVFRAEITYSCNAPSQIDVLNHDWSQWIGVDAQSLDAEHFCGVPGGSGTTPTLQNACIDKPLGYIAQPIVLTVDPAVQNETYIFATYGFLPAGCAFTVRAFQDGQLIQTLTRTLLTSNYPFFYDVFGEYS